MVRHYTDASVLLEGHTNNARMPELLDSTRFDFAETRYRLDLYGDSRMVPFSAASSSW
jgi:hypothetical protein